MADEVTVATRLVLICNPNNPTSTALGLDAGRSGSSKRVPPNVCVILDEAYVEFSLALGDPYASVELLRRHPNLVLLRTFSKVYGLAGLRVGYALCGSVDFRVAVDQVRQPFYLGIAAQAAAIEALRHQDEVERRVERTIADAAVARGGASAGSGCGWPSPTPTSSGCTCPRRSTRRDVVARPGGARRARAGPAVARARGRAAGDGRHRRRERALRRRAGRDRRLAWSTEGRGESPVGRGASPIRQQLW